MPLSETPYLYWNQLFLSLFSVRVVRRFVIPGEVGAWVATGRWGPRRLRVEECTATLAAETAYDFVIFDAAVRARARGELTWRVGGRIHPVQWELRSNCIWRDGRLFFRCACGRLVARLYLPTPDTRMAACRSCFGLSYESRQANYRDNVGLLRHLGLSARAFALRETWLRRQRSRQVARARAKRRRELRGRLIARL